MTKLKLISLFMGMMFWYGIEQLFMNNVLHDPNARMWTTIVFTATWLIFDIPAGMLADRYGRKTMLTMSAVLQTSGIIVYSLSNSVPVYLIGTVLYGLHWSSFSGTIQALMYDHLHENGKHLEYPKHQGAVTAYGYVGASLANLLSGFIVNASSCERHMYFQYYRQFSVYISHSVYRS